MLESPPFRGYGIKLIDFIVNIEHFIQGGTSGHVNAHLNIVFRCRQADRLEAVNTESQVTLSLLPRIAPFIRFAKISGVHRFPPSVEAQLPQASHPQPLIAVSGGWSQVTDGLLDPVIRGSGRKGVVQAPSQGEFSLSPQAIQRSKISAGGGSAQLLDDTGDTHCVQLPGHAPDFRYRFLQVTPGKEAQNPPCKVLQ